jgi:hypothetical protein
LHSEYLLHVSSKRNFHELDNTLEVTRVDDREDGAESSDKNADTSDNNYKDWMMMIEKKCRGLKLNPLAHFAIIALI